MAIEKLMGASLSEKIWPLMGALFLMVGIQLFVSGILADILVKNYYKARNRMNYSVKEVTER